MTAFDDGLIRTIDDRIKRFLPTLTARGTVVSRDTTGPVVQVLFDGDSIAMPVKCAGNVFCQANDRVVLTKHGPTWVVIGAFTGPGYGEMFRRINFSGATTAYNTTSFTDLTEWGTKEFVKFYDNTFIRVGMSWQGFMSAGNTGVEFGFRMTQTVGSGAYTPADVACGRCLITTSGNRGANSGAARLGAVPAGTYTVSYRIRRYVGTGTINGDASDTVWMEMDERVSAGNPVL